MSNYLKSLFQACRKRSARVPLLTLAGLSLAVVGIFASNTTWAGLTRSDTAYPLSELASPISSGTASGTTEKLNAQVILLRPYGFEPAVITRPKGQVLLVVLNRSGIREANYVLSSVASIKLHEAKVPREKLDWHQLADLAPGDYTLRETNHPEWICKITVTEK